MAQAQERELGAAREQLMAVQRERDEANRRLNQYQQNAGGQGGAAPVQQAVQNQVVGVQNSDIGNLVSAMTFSQLECNMPKFSDENESHPLEFLEKLEKFF